MENYEAAFSGSEEEENDKQRSGDPSRKEEAAKLDNESDKERGLEVDDDLVAKAIPPVAESSPPNPTYYFYQCKYEACFGTYSDIYLLELQLDIIVSMIYSL